MFKRKLMLPLMVATAAGGPYLLMDENLSQSAFQMLDRAITADESPTGALPAPVAATAAVPLPDFRSEFTYGPNAQYPQANPDANLVGPPVSHLGEILRFDIGPRWITDRWPRVTATLAEQGLEGLRVPVVTGTNLDDLAGSLTYYFNRFHQLQRLTFEGYTGDERKLVSVVTQHYDLRPEPTLDAGMYVARWNNRPTSILRVARAPIMTHDSPHSHFHVLLELNRPSMEFGLSNQAQLILERDRNTKRW